MSGLETVRDGMGKPVALVAACGAVAVMGMAALWWASAAPQHDTERSALQPACIALAIDRNTGTTHTQPCAGSAVLVAGKEPIAK